MILGTPQEREIYVRLGVASCFAQLYRYSDKVFSDGLFKYV